MSTFSPSALVAKDRAPDPNKHINYNAGMVLGEDEFKQEFAYLSNRDRWLARDLLGYGSVEGLDITSGKQEQNDPIIFVSPGVAVNPRGQMIRVSTPQQANINSWLQTPKIEETLSKRLNNGELTIYLTLGYLECETDFIPLPGKDCGNGSNTPSLHPSRLRDSFALDFLFEAPNQPEEDALRAFVGWLRKIRIAPIGMELEKFLDFIRVGASNNKGFFSESPASNASIPRVNVATYWREAFLLWVTELRPIVRGRNLGQTFPAMEDCILLAEITFKIKGSEKKKWTVDGDLLINESRRPFLIHQRLLQEWLLSIESEKLMPSSGVVPENMFGQVPSVGTSEEYARADHSHGTPPMQPGSASSNNHSDMLGGDVQGHLGDTIVTGIQDIPVSSAHPAHGQVLGFVADHWEPVTPAVAPGSAGSNPAPTFDYRTIAAGICLFDISKPFADITTSHNGLAASAITRSAFGAEIHLTFPSYEFNSQKTAYIVKLTPWRDEQSDPFIAWMVRFDLTGFVIEVGSTFQGGSSLNGQLMIEVSTFEPDGV